MIKLVGKIPDDIFLALSGGHDSMAALDFIKNNPKKNITALFFHHGTDNSEIAYNFVKDYWNNIDVKLHTGHIKKIKNNNESLEEYWRNQRLNFFYNFKEKNIITGHNLDDAVETFIFNMINGKSHTMPYRHGNIIRPFLLTHKKTLLNWCMDKSVKYIEDCSNKNVKFSRNRIRHNIMPEILKINPGIYKVVAKKIKTDFQKQLINNEADINKKIGKKYEQF